MIKDFYHLKRDNNPKREDAFTLSCLGKIHPASLSDFLRCRGYLSELIKDYVIDCIETGSINTGFIENTGCSSDSGCVPADNKILIIGLTESGIIPAFLMYIETIYKNINADILYSTRRELDGIPFKESHSHGPDHVLPIPDCEIKEIWIVEDEITSGNTVYNLIIQLSDYIKINRVRIFAFADFRDDNQKSEFALKIALKNIESTFHIINLNKTLNNTNSYTDFIDKIFVNNNVQEIRRTKIKKGNEIVEINRTKEVNRIEGMNKSNNIIRNKDLKVNKEWHFPENRPALSIKSGSFINFDLSKSPFYSFSSEFKNRGTILAVGEAVDLAACIALKNKNIKFQQISLSPWKVDNRSIFSRIKIAEKYYLYNYENLKDPALNPIFIMCDPIDKLIEQDAITQLKNNGIDVKPLFESKSLKFKMGN